MHPKQNMEKARVYQMLRLLKRSDIVLK